MRKMQKAEGKLSARKLCAKRDRKQLFGEARRMSKNVNGVVTKAKCVLRYKDDVEERETLFEQNENNRERNEGKKGVKR